MVSGVNDWRVAGVLRLGLAMPRVGQDIGRLGHEVHATEDDVATAVVLGRQGRQAEAIAREVSELDHLVLLVVVAEHQQFVPEVLLGDSDALLQLGIVELSKRIKALRLAGNMERRGGHVPMLGASPGGVNDRGARPSGARWTLAAPELGLAKRNSSAISCGEVP